MTAFRLLYWLAALVLLAPRAQAADVPALTSAQYVERINAYKDELAGLKTVPQRALPFRDSLPDTVSVHTTRGDVSVDMRFLRDALNRYLTSQAAAKPAILASAENRLQAMSAEAELYEQPSRADDTMRQRLDKILSASEFDRVRGPTAVELFKQRLQAWILNLLRKINPKVPDIEDAGQLFVWCAIALAAAIAGTWLYRKSRENMVLGRREILPFLPSPRNWREWLAEARARAANGEWRDAIHFGFWAAVSRLEAEGVWPPDKARTPREYLNAIPASNFSKEPFAAVTRKFESSWYGSRPTTEADFAQFATHLETLGCR